ncbi:MAG: amylo-alpha-1,6-glucosidase [Candidatus Bathyarchaeia archaeon]
MIRGDLPRIYVGPESLSNFNRAVQHEWIVTNGFGGYASSTVLNINTRKYHGLLVAAFNPPVDRYVLLSKMDEEVWIGDDNYPLGANEFRDTVYPDGYKWLRSFSLSPFPTFNYRASGLYLRKQVFMPHLKSMVIIRYEVLNSLNDAVRINIYPLINMRHFYETTNRYSQQLRFVQEPTPKGIIFETQPRRGHLALFSTDDYYVQGKNVWIERIYFRVDDSRGEDCTDDNYQPGFFTIELPPKQMKVSHVVAIGGRTKEEIISLRPATFGKNHIEKLYAEEIIRRERLLRKFYENKAGTKPEDWLNWLILSADSFIVTRKSTGKKSVIAGYHWFEDWGRDALISLPGLTLVTGRPKDAEEIFLTFKQYCRDGLIPNRFPDRSGDKPAYGSVDAALWFFHAVLQYLKYTGRFDFVYEDLWDTLRDIVEWHIRGTAFGIRMDDDGLLMHGPRLTWMDVSIEDRPVTPREGKAVEIQALWYNALRIMEMLALRFDQKDDAERYRSTAEKARTSFNEKFWWSKGNYLLDTVDREAGDASLRPNQIVAVYLDFCMLDSPRRESTVDAVWRGLWGTYGLKSLSSDDPKYIGKYTGGFTHRDMAYHNGTVWAWLVGPFVTAFLKTKNHREYWRRFAFDRFLQPLFLEETHRAGLGTLSEIFDGDPPHSPRGCISQAWSVAEPLRAFVEDVLLERPPYEREILSPKDQ